MGVNRGEIPSIVGQYVRLADKDFTVNDLVEHIYDSKPELEVSGRGAVRQSVAQSLRRYADRNVIVEVGRGTFGAIFMMQILKVIGCEELHLEK